MMTRDGIVSPEALIRACITDEDEEPDFRDVLHRCGLQADIACAFKAANLSEREEGVLYARYVTGLDMPQTGKIYGVTRERIRQIEAKALRKINGRKASREILLHGMEAYVDKYLDSIRDRERERYDSMIEDFKRRWIEDHPDGRELKPEEALRSDLSVTPIEELDLSVRAYNCLKRAGCATVQQIIAFVEEHKPDWYSRVRNLGKKSADEVARKVFELTGVQINTWETVEVIYGKTVD